MKYLKIYEEFREPLDIEYINAKMTELSDLMSEYSGISFEYNIESKEESDKLQGILKVSLKATDTVAQISWELDLDSPHLIVKELNENDSLEEIYNSHLSSVEEGLDVIEKHIYDIFEISERVKAQRYKGRKIPGKYLTKNPSKMKKEIDRFVGKKEYKKDWDADYESGKGGKGKRVKTKKSAATKAYQRMFGDK
jgi:hypothetical protein